LTNLTDSPSSGKDATFVMQNDSSIKKNPKFCSATVKPLDRHSIKYHTGEPEKMNHHGHELVNDQEDLNIPKNIPTIINGCVSPLKDEKVFFYNYTKELYATLINAKNSYSKFANHKILLIGDSHLRGYSEMMKSKLSGQFYTSGFTIPGANASTILNQLTKEVDNFTVNDFIILCCGLNDTGSVKLNMVLNISLNSLKE
jgi:hypothetical protein